MRDLLAGLLLAWGLLPPGSHAQSPASSAQSDSLNGALQRLSALAGVSLVYEADLVQGHAADCALDAERPAATLRCLVDGTGLDFVQTSGGTYVVKRDVRRPPQPGTVRGVVRGKEGPLPSAHVRVAGEDAGTTSNGEGAFRLPGLPAGRHTLIVGHLGYETVRSAVSVRAGGAIRDTIVLSPRPVAVGPIVVDAPSNPELPRSRKHAALGPSALVETSPAGTPSVAHAASRLLGLTTTAPFADLHVQAGASGHHEVRLDGVPVRNPAAAGRLLGAFSPLALDGLTAHKAGFGARYGDALSGVVTLEHDLQRRDAQRTSVRVDPVSVDTRADGRLDLGGSSLQVMGAGRIGVWGVHQAQTLSHLIDTWSALDPVLTAAQLSADSSLADGHFDGQRARPRSRFYDLHGAARLSLGPREHLSLSAYRGRSVLATDLAAGPGSPAVPELHFESTSGDGARAQAGGVEVPRSDRYAWSNTVAQARYDAALSPRATGAVQGYLSRYRARSSYTVGTLRTSSPLSSGDPPVPGSRTTNTVTEVGVDATAEVDFADRHELTLTGGVTSLSTRVHLRNAFLAPFRHTAGRTRLTGAGTLSMALGPATTVDGGLRLTALGGTVYAEPRLAARYQHSSPDLGEWALRVGGGLYRQFTSRVELSRDGTTAVVPTAQAWVPTPRGLSPPRAYHLTADLSWTPPGAWSTSAEGYVKWKPHLLAVDYPAAAAAPGRITAKQLLSSSQGRTYGGGVRVGYDAPWATGTLRYAYSRARRTFPGRFDGRRVPAPWSQPHRLTLEGHVPLVEGLALTARATGIWGRQWGYRQSYYAYLLSGAGSDGPSLGRPASHTLPPLYRVDTGLRARQTWGGVTITGRVGVVNALGRANVAEWGLVPGSEGPTRSARTLPGRRVVVSFQLQY